MNAHLVRLIRFIEIDYNFLQTPSNIINKVYFLFETNLTIFVNLFLRFKNFSPVIYKGVKIFYDTPYATKTFLTAVYDLYMVSMRGTIFNGKSNIIVVDIGGNIGQFSFAVKELFPKAKIYTVEPDKEIFTILNKNTSSRSDITTYNYALSNKSGKLSFFVSKEFSEWSSLKKIEGHSYVEKSVQVRRGDDLFKSLKNIDLLKVDVEGAEYETMLGFKKILPKVKYLLIELSILRNESDPGSSRLLEYLLKNDFALYNVGRIFSEGKGMQQGAADILFVNTKLN